MNSTSLEAQQHPFATLRGLARRRDAVEHCDMCAAALAPEHQHLVEPAARKLVCACDACAILFPQGAGTKYKRVARRVRWLRDFRMTDGQWDGLLIPIGMAFFLKSTIENRVLAFYPSPAGPTESLLSLEAWNDIVQDNPALNNMEPDVEALLVNRINHAEEYFVAPIDKCYELVGLIRAHWRGLSGGTEVWREIRRFFDELKRRDPEAANA
jgi:hypothetical protein